MVRGALLLIFLSEVAAVRSTDFATPRCQPGYHGRPYAVSGLPGHAQQCFACAKGTYSLANSCMPCPAGKYAPRTGSSECWTCAVGRFQPSPGRSVCSSCPENAGFVTVGGRKYCGPVTTSPTPGPATALTCAPGYYSATLMLNRARGTRSFTKCVLCGGGTFKQHWGDSGCMACPAGQISTEQRTTCTDKTCPVGRVPTAVWNGPTKTVGCKKCGRNMFRKTKDECWPCPTGKFTAHGQDAADECHPHPRPTLKCGAGQYLPRWRPHAIDTCIFCPFGQIQPLHQVHVHTCHACPAGHFANAERTACSKTIGCPRGQFVKSALHIDFPEGGALPQHDYEACDACAPGKYGEVVNGRAVCLDCVVGRFSATPGATECIACGAGTFAVDPGATTCINGVLKCSPGQRGELAANGGSICYDCKPGQYQYRAGAYDCFHCQGDTYQDAASATQCNSCDTSKHDLNTERTACVPKPPPPATAAPLKCAAGRYATHADGMGEYCLDCAAGQHQSHAGMRSCEPCAPGRFQFGVGRAHCDACPQNTFQPDFGRNHCLADGSKCPAGKFGRIHCRYCPARKFQDLKYQTSCKTCAVGRYQQYPNQENCRPCAIGRAQPSAGQARCDLCSQGKTTLATGADKCVTVNPCPQGEAKAGAGCAACEAGTFRADVTRMTCEPCAAGQFQDGKGAAACKRCPEGKYAGAIGQAACEIIVRQGPHTTCKPGHYQHSVHGVCYVCPRGKFQPSSGRVLCLDCAAGHFQEQEGAVKCKACKDGQYVSIQRATECEYCPMGKFVPHSEVYHTEHGSMFTDEERGYTACLLQQTPSPTPAAPKEHQDHDHDEDHYGDKQHNDEHSSSHATPGALSNCGDGKYRLRRGVIWICADCETGRHRGGDMPQHVCAACAPGRFAEFSGQATCAVCAADSIARHSEASECTPCADSTFANTARTSCSETAPAAAMTTVAPVTPAPTPSHCAIGTRLNAAENKCEECMGGHYSDEADQLACKPCGPGRYQAASGQGQCNACAIGKHQPLQAQLSCIDCQIGRHQGRTGMDHCIGGMICAPGRYGVSSPHGHERHLTQCIDCLPGKYQPLSGAERCTACPFGQYQLESGQIMCHHCAVGTYMPQGAILCEECPMGTYGDVVRTGAGTHHNQRALCRGCGKGHYQGAAGQAHCLMCPRGRFNDLAAGATECKACPPGYTTPGLGSYACQLEVPCPAGQFGTVVGGDVVCHNCTSGRYNPLPSVSGECKLCPAGQVQPEGGQDSCAECGAGKFSSVRDNPVLCTDHVVCPDGEQAQLVGPGPGEAALPSSSNKAWVCVFEVPTTTVAPTTQGPTAAASTAAPVAGTTSAPTPEPTHGTHYYDCDAVELKWIALKMQQHVYRSHLEAAQSLGCVVPAGKVADALSHGQAPPVPPTPVPDTLSPTPAPTPEPTRPHIECSAGKFLPPLPAVHCQDCPAGKFGAVTFGTAYCFNCDAGTASAAGQTFCSHELAIRKRSVKCSHVQCEYVHTASGWRIRTLHHGKELFGTRHICTHSATTHTCSCKCYSPLDFESRHTVLDAAAASP